VRRTELCEFEEIEKSKPEKSKAAPLKCKGCGTLSYVGDFASACLDVGQADSLGELRKSRVVA